MPLFDFFKYWLYFLADILRFWASWVKTTSRGEMRGIEGLTLNINPLITTAVRMEEGTTGAQRGEGRYEK